MDHGTDRDVALAIVSALNTCAELVASVNDNLYIPHITTQPVNAEGEIEDTVTFSVVANNVSAYQWQYKREGIVTWFDSSLTGYNTDTLSVEINEQRLTYKYRCKLTGKDGSIIYTDIVEIVAPST